MKLSKIADICKLERIVFSADDEINSGYCGDLMSDVMANSESNSIWVTIQAHKNSIAVALIKDIKAILFTNNVSISREVIEKAEEEKINIFRTTKNSFTISGEIYKIMEEKTAKD
ncbi:MAG: DRTGG domain-containing protein [Candidatus Caldatribacteriota bacterium]|nr:DRTGG domain-containing protein [Candidatus Caldatribacteriota bacterium]